MSPIRPENRALDPENWREIALEVKAAARWTCADCGRACRTPDEPFRGHRDPTNNAPSNLRALCSGCHNRYDSAHRATTRRRTQEAKKA